jgi:hypothetical protein
MQIKTIEVKCRFGMVPVSVGDKFNTGDGEWEVREIDTRNTINGYWEIDCPILICHNPARPDYGAHAIYAALKRPGLVCHLLDEANLKSITFGNLGAFSAEWVGMLKNREATWENRFAAPVEAEGLLVFLDTHIDDQLRDEGNAREIVRLVQNTRKNAKLEMRDEVELVLEAKTDEFRLAIEAMKEYICYETSATLVASLEGEGVVASDEKSVSIKVKKK